MIQQYFRFILNIIILRNKNNFKSKMGLSAGGAATGHNTQDNAPVMNNRPLVMGSGSIDTGAVSNGGASFTDHSQLTGASSNFDFSGKLNMPVNVGFAPAGGEPAAP